GPPGEAFIKGAAAVGVTKLGADLEELAGLAAYGSEALVATLERAVAFSRWRAPDVRSILAAGAGRPEPAPAVRPWSSTCRWCPPSAATRPEVPRWSPSSEPDRAPGVTKRVHLCLD